MGQTPCRPQRGRLQRPIRQLPRLRQHGRLHRPTRQLLCRRQRPTTGISEASPDRAALEALYRAADGPNWTNKANWLSDAPLRAWHGVDTNEEGRVTELDLYDNQLRGEIPSELGDLANLRALWLHGNQLSGQIPYELGILSNLESLYLSGNRLSGCIPGGLRDVEENDLDDLVLPFCSAAGATSADRAALEALYNATGGPNWTNNANWLSDAPLARMAWRRHQRRGQSYQAGPPRQPIERGDTLRDGQALQPGIASAL